MAARTLGRNDGLFRKHRVLVHGKTRDGAEAFAYESGVDLGTNGDDLSDGLVSEAGGKVHLFHVDAVIVHTFGPVKAHCFDLELNFTRTGLALGQIFNTKNIGTTKLVESDGFRHGEDTPVESFLLFCNVEIDRQLHFISHYSGREFRRDSECRAADRSGT